MRLIEAITLLCLLTIGVTYWLNPTYKYLQPQSLSYHNGTLTSVRLTPRGKVFANWASEVRGNGLDCSANGSATYQDVGLSPVSFEAEPRLLPCISLSSPFEVSIRYRVEYGILQLWPLITTWLCQADGTACQRI